MIAFGRRPRARAVLPGVALSLAAVTAMPPGEPVTAAARGTAVASATRGAAVAAVVPDAEVAAMIAASIVPALAPAGPALRVSLLPADAVGPALEAGSVRGIAPPDLVLIGEGVLPSACAAGLLRPLPGDAGTCGVGGPAENIVLGWNRQRLDGPPPGWRDLWEPARLPGRRGLPRQAAGTLEIALLADGIAASEVYRVLGTAAGVRRAFHRLDQLSPYVVWWTSGADAVRVLRSGAVVMTALPASSLPRAPAIGVQWEDHLVERSAWAIPAGAPHVDAASRVLASIEASGAIAALDAARAQAPPPEAGTGLVVDGAFWAAHAPLQRRFARWIARQ